MSPIKAAVGLVLAGTLGTGGIAMTDQQINPYKTVQIMDAGVPVSALEIAASSTLPEAGTNTTIIDTTKPKITLSKWNGEVALGVTYTSIQATGARPLLSKNVDWTSGSQTMEAVPIDATTTMEDGGMEININLASKPSSNVFTFQLDNWQNLDFFYQAPLWQEAGLNASTPDCTDTSCSTSEGNSYRSDNIVGSYAVYYKNHANHLLGQQNYATGKAYQIFRPQVSDAHGNIVWADLSYSNGILSVTVPQSFLDTAVYPVKIDPTFGYTTIGGTTSQSAGFPNDGLDSGHSQTGAAGTLTDINVYLTKHTLASNVNTVLYKSSDASIVVSVSGTTLVGNTTPQWFDFGGFTTSISAIGYYISFGVDTSNDSVIYYYDTVGSANRCADTSGWLFPSDPATCALISSAREISIYATYTASGGGTTVTPDTTYFQSIDN